MRNASSWIHKEAFTDERCKGQSARRPGRTEERSLGIVHALDVPDNKRLAACLDTKVSADLPFLGKPTPELLESLRPPEVAWETGEFLEFQSQTAAAAARAFCEPPPRRQLPVTVTDWVAGPAAACCHAGAGASVSTPVPVVLEWSLQACNNKSTVQEH